MSVAKTTGTTQYISFMLGEAIFALGIEKVREIMDFSMVTNVPQMPQFMRGLVNLRGCVAPVIDLRPKFGLTRTENTATTSVIIAAVTMAGDTTELGVLADRVLEVVDLGPDKFDPAPGEGITGGHGAIQGTRKHGSALYSILDIDKIFTAEYLSLVSSVCAGVSPDSLKTCFCKSDRKDALKGGIEDLNTMITVAKNFDDLLKVLDVMAQEAYRITNTKQVQAEEIQCMASYLTEIRLLLNEQMRNEANTIDSSKNMFSRYMELEGRVKEMRNDLDQAIKRVTN